MSKHIFAKHTRSQFTSLVIGEIKEKCDDESDYEAIEDVDVILDEMSKYPKEIVEGSIVCLDIPDDYEIVNDYLEYGEDPETMDHIVVIAKEVRILNLNKESTYNDLIIPFNFDK